MSPPPKVRWCLKTNIFNISDTNPILGILGIETEHYYDNDSSDEGRCQRDQVFRHYKITVGYASYESGVPLTRSMLKWMRLSLKLGRLCSIKHQRVRRPCQTRAFLQSLRSIVDECVHSARHGRSNFNEMLEFLRDMTMFLDVSSLLNMSCFCSCNDSNKYIHFFLFDGYHDHSDSPSNFEILGKRVRNRILLYSIGY